MSPTLLVLEYVATGTAMEIDIRNKNYRAVELPDSLFDLGNERLWDRNHANKQARPRHR